MVETLKQLRKDMSKRTREEIIVDARYIELFSPQNVRDAEQKIRENLCVKYSQIERKEKDVAKVGKKRKFVAI